MDKMSRDKTKAFKTTDAFIKDVDELVKKSGKTQSEFFEDLITDLKLKRLEQNDQISRDLRKHFEVDIQKMKTATHAIISLFTSQMENISVEKDGWESMTTRQLNEKQIMIEELENQIKMNREQLEQMELGVNELSEVNQSILKERETLSKRIEDLEQLGKDRKEKNQELKERVNKLNEMLINKDEELTSVETIKADNKKLEDAIQQLNEEKKTLMRKHQEEINRLLFNFEKEKYALRSELLSGFNKEKEELRNEVRQATEQNTRGLYLNEIKRKEKEHKEEVKEFKVELQKLLKTIDLKEETHKKEIQTLKDSISIKKEN